MNGVQLECRKRNIKRVCHFTQSRNLAHIFGDYIGVLSTKTLKESNYPHNPTDQGRYDGCDHLISCSIEYPNPFYFDTARRREPLFEDWVVLIMDEGLIWQSGTQYCPCNASTERGTHITSNFLSLFLSPSQGSKRSRKPNHFVSSPTDIQAEVLIPEPIRLEKINAIAVESEEQAKREILRIKLQGIPFNKKIYIVPDFFKGGKKLANMIQHGQHTKMVPYCP